MELTACSAGTDSSKNRVPAVAAEGGLCQSPGSQPDTRQVPGLRVCDLHRGQGSRCECSSKKMQPSSKGRLQQPCSQRAHVSSVIQ